MLGSRRHRFRSAVHHGNTPGEVGPVIYFWPYLLHRVVLRGGGCQGKDLLSPVCGPSKPQTEERGWGSPGKGLHLACQSLLLWSSEEQNQKWTPFTLQGRAKPKDEMAVRNFSLWFCFSPFEGGRHKPRVKCLPVSQLIKPKSQADSTPLSC